MTNLTKPQADLLFSLMRKQRSADTAERAVCNRLRRRGYVELGDVAWTPTSAGLEALADYWMRKDAVSGCLAYQLYRQEVDAALEARFPRALPIAA